MQESVARLRARQDAANMTSLRYARGPLSSGRRFVRCMNHVRQVDSVLPADGGRPVRPTRTYGRAAIPAISFTGTQKAPSGTNEDRASTPTCLVRRPDQRPRQGGTRFERLGIWRGARSACSSTVIGVTTIQFCP